jgi:hypothetical protein
MKVASRVYKFETKKSGSQKNVNFVVENRNNDVSKEHVYLV